MIACVKCDHADETPAAQAPAAERTPAKVKPLAQDVTTPATMFDPELTYYADGTTVVMRWQGGEKTGTAAGMTTDRGPYQYQAVQFQDGTTDNVAPHVLHRTETPAPEPERYVAEYETPAVLLPVRIRGFDGALEALCPCDASVKVRDGKLRNHFPPMYQGRPPTLKDPFLPGNSLCRYTGRTVTLAAALARDEAPTPEERETAAAVRMNPSAWLGLLDWVTFEDVKVGDRIGFTDTEDSDGYESRFVRHEREGIVTRKGATFVTVDCAPDALGDKARLKKKDWKSFRTRRKY